MRTTLEHDLELLDEKIAKLKEEILEMEERLDKVLGENEILEERCKMLETQNSALSGIVARMDIKKL